MKSNCRCPEALERAPQGTKEQKGRLASKTRYNILSFWRTAGKGETNLRLYQEFKRDPHHAHSTGSDCGLEGFAHNKLMLECNAGLVRMIVDAAAVDAG